LTLNFKEFLELLEHGPHVYLVIEYDGGKQLKTKMTRIQKEIEYHIKLVETTPDSGATDIYGDSLQRALNTINESGALINNERINIDSLANGKLPGEIRERFQNLLNNYDDIIKNYTSWQALFSGILITTLKAENLDIIGYDGPQVPRNSWREGNDEVIMWPRREQYNWE
jgi:hypothetical protein